MLKKIWLLLPHREFPGFRVLHFAIAILILSQIINSNLVSTDALDETGTDNIVTWFHILSGAGLIVLGILLMLWMLHKRGVRYYYSWLFLDFSGIKYDINTLKRFSLPDAHHGGIASTIQGLGVLALLAVSLSGALWFVCDYFSILTVANTDLIITLHRFLTSFIEVYFFAHGAMGILHMGMSYATLRRAE